MGNATGHPSPGIPDDHPVRATFLALTKRGLDQSDIHDQASVRYISNLMTEFLRTEDLYALGNEQGPALEHVADLLSGAETCPDLEERKRRYKHLGDFALFMLGLFPEYLDRPRRAVGPDYYAEQGRRSYNIVADLAWADSEPDLFRRLSGQFEQYVRGLNWVKLYTQDPFYQYMFREFGIT